MKVIHDSPGQLKIPRCFDCTKTTAVDLIGDTTEQRARFGCCSVVIKRENELETHEMKNTKITV